MPTPRHDCMPFRITVTMKAIWMRFDGSMWNVFMISLLNAMSVVTRFVRERSREARFGQVMNHHLITDETKQGSV